jgi:hypothetical protein
MSTSEITFASRLDREHYARLEALLFFNRCQGRVRSGIVAAIDRYGAPEIVETDDRLRVRVAGLHDVQCLFAMESSGQQPRPVGLIVYVRDSFERITVLHLVVAEEYAAGGALAGQHLPFRLVQAVRQVARRTQGIRRVELLYTQDRARAAYA